MSGVIGKVIKVAAIVGIGLGVDSLIHCIKANTGAGMEKCPLDPDTKASLKKFQNALDKITGKQPRQFLIGSNPPANFS